jgi:hypothetical protein
MSASRDPQAAANLSLMTGEDGPRFAEAVPVNPRRAAVDLRWNVDPVLPDGVLFSPGELEHKWGIYLNQSRLLFVRSWTCAVQVAAHRHRARDGAGGLRPAPAPARGPVKGKTIRMRPVVALNSPAIIPRSLSSTRPESAGEPSSTWPPNDSGVPSGARGVEPLIAAPCVLEMTNGLQFTEASPPREGS